MFCCSHGCCCDHGINAICVVCMLAVFAIHIYMHIHTHTYVYTYHTHTHTHVVCMFAVFTLQSLVGTAREVVVDQAA